MIASPSVFLTRRRDAFVPFRAWHGLEPAFERTKRLESSVAAPIIRVCDEGIVIFGTFRVFPEINRSADLVM